MTDTLHISGLRILTHIGVYAWEQRIKQPLLLDITLFLSKRVEADALDQTLNYDALCQEITLLVESLHAALIETVAESVASFIKAHFSVMRVQITVHKPHAIRNASSVSISIER